MAGEHFRSQSPKVGTTLEFLINFGFRKPALRVGIIPAGRNSTSTVPSLAGQAQAGHTLSLPGTSPKWGLARSRLRGFWSGFVLTGVSPASCSKRPDVAV